MRVAVGGTFDVFHKGHEALLGGAISTGGELLIGLTTDEMAGRTRGFVTEYEKREQLLKNYLHKKAVKKFRIVPISDEFGPAAHEKLDAIIVSAEKRPVVERLNQERVKRGFTPLEIRIVPMQLAEDCLPISSKRIRAGEITRSGINIRGIKVNVGTGNRLKVSAVRKVLSSVYEKVKVCGISVDSGVPPEPFEKDVVIGALNRAKQAIGEADYGVGIEAGLFWHEPVRDFLDVQYCAVVDKVGRITLGHGPGFSYPNKVITLVKQGNTVGLAMEKLTGRHGLGSKQGAIGHLSKGRLKREELTKMAVYTAFLPRIRRDIYWNE